jgi:hypothetical protein
VSILKGLNWSLPASAHQNNATHTQTGLNQNASGKAMASAMRVTQTLSSGMLAISWALLRETVVSVLTIVAVLSTIATARGNIVHSSSQPADNVTPENNSTRVEVDFKIASRYCSHHGIGYLRSRREISSGCYGGGRFRPIDTAIQYGNLDLSSSSRQSQATAESYSGTVPQSQ